jgi:hypothetical protein
VFKFAIGGPVLPFAGQDMKERFTFYFNGAGEWLDGRLKDYYVSDPNKDFSYAGRSSWKVNMIAMIHMKAEKKTFWE